MVLTQKQYPLLKGNSIYQKASPFFARLHRYSTVISNLAASAVSIIFLTFFSDFYSPLKHPHIR